MTIYTIYAIKLQNNKWFLETVPDAYTNMDVCLNCQIKYEYVRQNLPAEIREYIQIGSESEIDYFVKKYMKFYGIDNVRGGSYLDSTMNIPTYKYLQEELSNKYTTIDIEHEILNAVYESYGDIHTWDKSHIREEMDQLAQIHHRYLQEKSQLTKLRQPDGRMNRNILHDINWLCSRIVFYANRGLLLPINADGTRVKHETPITDVIAYKRVLSNLQMVYRIYMDHIDDSWYTASCNNFEPKLYLMQPKMIFDTFFYHAHKTDELKTNFAIVDQMIDWYEYAYYCIMTRIDELEFDVNSYGENYEKRYDFTIQFLQNYLNISQN